MKPARSWERMTRLSNRPATNSSTRVDGVLARDDRRDELDEMLDRDRVEEVQTEHVLRAAGGHRELHDRDRRGIRSDDGIVVLEDLVDVGEEIELLVERLDDGLDHEVTVAEVADVGGEEDTGEHGVALHLVDLLRPYSTRERVLDAHQAADAVLTSVSHTITSAPARAQTSAMPEPMSPAPTTPTRSIPTSALSLTLCCDQFRGSSVWIDNSVSDSSGDAIEARTAADGIGLLGDPLEHNRANSSRTRSSRRSRELPGRHEMTAMRGDRVDELVEAAAFGGDRGDDRRRPFAACSPSMSMPWRSRTVASVPPRSALFTTNTSPTSSRPALLAWIASPQPGVTTTIVVSAVPAIATSTWPTPTVSTSTHA